METSVTLLDDDRMPEPSAPAESAERRFARYASGGDPALLEQLVVESLDQAHAVALRILGRKDLAEDAVQEAYIRLWRTAPRYHTEIPFLAWVMRLVLSCALDQARAQRRRQRHEVAAPRSSAVAVVADGAPELEPLRHALTALPQRLSAPIHLVYFLAMSQGEAAQVLGVPPGTVASRLNRARGRLRAALEPAQDLSGLLVPVVGLARADHVAPAYLQQRVLGAVRPFRRPPAGLTGPAQGWLLAGILCVGVLLLATAHAGHATVPAPAPGPPPLSGAATPAPRSAVTSAQVTFLGGGPFQSTQRTTHLAISPDSRSLLLASLDGLQECDLASARPHWRLFPDQLVSQVQYRPDGTIVCLVTAYQAPPVIALIEPRSGVVTRTIPLPATYTGDYIQSGLSPDGRLLCTNAFQDPLVHIWDLGRGLDLATVPGPGANALGAATGAVSACAFSPDGLRLAVSFSTGLAIWSWPGLKLVDFISCAPAVLEQGMGWLADGQHVQCATSYRDDTYGVGTIDLVGRTVTRQTCWTISGPGGEQAQLGPTSVTFGDGHGGSWTQALPPDFASHDLDGQFSRDGAWFCSNKGDRAPLVERMATRQLVAPASQSNTRPPDWLGFTEDGHVVCKGGQQVTVWDPQGAPCRSLPVADESVDGLHGRVLITTGPTEGDGGPALVWDLITATQIGTIAAFWGPPPLGGMRIGHVHVQAEVSPDGRYLVTGSQDACLRIHDLVTGRDTATLEGYRAPTNYSMWARELDWSTCAFLPGAHCLLSTNNEVTAASELGEQFLPLTGIYQLATGLRLMPLLYADGTEVEGGSFTASPDGSLIFGLARRELNHTFRQGGFRAGRDYVLVSGLWDATTGSFLRELAEPRDVVRFCADGSRLVSDRGVVDVATGASLRAFPPCVLGAVAPLGDLVMQCTITTTGAAHVTIRASDTGTVLRSIEASFPGYVTGRFAEPEPDSSRPLPRYLAAQSLPLWNPAEDAVLIATLGALPFGWVRLFPVPAHGSAASSAVTPQRIHAALGDLACADVGVALAAGELLDGCGEGAVPAIQTWLGDPASTSSDARCRALFVLEGVMRRHADPALQAVLQGLAGASDSDATTRRLAVQVLARLHAADGQRGAARRFAGAPPDPWPPRSLVSF